MRSLDGNRTFQDMLNLTDLAPYDLPPGTLVDALFSDPASAERSSLIAKLRDWREKGQAALEKQREKLRKLFEQVAQNDAESTELADLAEIVLRGERAAAERLRPRLEALQEKLAAEGHKLDPEMRRYFQENLDIGAGWLEFYKTLRDRLHTLASGRKPGSEVILPARPMAGDVDYPRLSREHIARYPKIRAALAE